MKQCYMCHETKPLSDFYKHKQMADGHINRCKSCSIEVSSKRDKDKIKSSRKKYYQENKEKCLKASKEWRRNNKEKHNQYGKEWRKRNPEKYKAHALLNTAVASGKIVKTSCRDCDETNVHAHHPDYSKPLNVIWLCPMHHAQEHA